MSRYELIDPILTNWAESHSIRWYSEYQDTEVRTFYLNENRRDRVQIAVDPPQNGSVTVDVGQNRRGLPRLNRVEKITASVSDLSDALNRAWNVANEWAAD